MVRNHCGKTTPTERLTMVILPTKAQLEAQLDAEGSLLPDGAVDAALRGIGEAHKYYLRAMENALVGDRCRFAIALDCADRLRHRYRKFGGTDWCNQMHDLREAAIAARKK